MRDLLIYNMIIRGRKIFWIILINIEKVFLVMDMKEIIVYMIKIG